MKTTFVVELKCEFDDESRYELVKEFMQEAARDILAKTSLLVDGNRLPQIALRSEDLFIGTEDINLKDE